MADEWCMIQCLCTGSTEHDGISCDGGEWQDVMSLPWFNGRPADALALFREDPDGGQLRIVRRTETVLDV
jgi:hypothetical protein